MASMNNENRQGRVTSSSAYLLIQNGRGTVFSKACEKYLHKKRIERKMKRTLDVDVYSRAMAWGKFMEMIIFSHLGLEYKIKAEDTQLHPSKEFRDVWAGSSDLLAESEDKIAEIKCYYPEKFALYTDALKRAYETGDLDELKRDFAQEYWQMVSNAILHDTSYMEAITFMPYQSELEDIRELARAHDGADQWKWRFIAEGEDDELPYLPDDSEYKNINIYAFEVPLDDIELLTQRMRIAKTILNQ